jgi:hypothetical protein
VRRLAAILLIALLGCLSGTASVAEAKGPLGKVVISGGDLTSELVIERAELVPIGPGFVEDTGGIRPIAYAPGDEIARETPYVVTIFELGYLPDGSPDNQLQQFLSEHYFPANSQHPSLLAQDGKLWKIQPAFAALLDGRIKSALSPTNLPSTGGPPNATTNSWAYALLAAGALLLFGSAAAVAYSRRS